MSAVVGRVSCVARFSSARVVPLQQQMSIRGPAPYSHEPAAVAERDAVDYARRFTLEEAVAGKADRPIRVLADGVYDCFHAGHAAQLRQCKLAFPSVYLIVGVCSEAETLALKGPTVMDERQRCEDVRHCRYVDEVVKAFPFYFTMQDLIDLKVDFVAHDTTSYTTGDDPFYAQFQRAGMFLETKRAENVSTTDVITKILSNRDAFVKRNLADGQPREELNVGWVEATTKRAQSTMDAFVKRFRA